MKAFEAMQVDHEHNILVGLIGPMAITTAVGHLMSFASGSLLEAAVMEGMSAVFELFEYDT